MHVLHFYIYICSLHTSMSYMEKHYISYIKIISEVNCIWLFLSSACVCTVLKQMGVQVVDLGHACLNAIVLEASVCFPFTYFKMCMLCGQMK